VAPESRQGAPKECSPMVCAGSWLDRRGWEDWTEEILQKRKILFPHGGSEDFVFPMNPSGENEKSKLSVFSVPQW